MKCAAWQCPGPCHSVMNDLYSSVKHIKVRLCDGEQTEDTRKGREEGRRGRIKKVGERAFDKIWPNLASLSPLPSITSD